MADQETKQLPYVEETVLKKRKNNEEWAIKRRERIEAQKQKNKDISKSAIKRPEQFVQEFREKVSIFIPGLWIVSRILLMPWELN